MKKYFGLLPLVWYLVNASTISAKAFDNNENKISDEKITYFHILGERCSGTNYVHYLIQQNFPQFYSKNSSTKSVVTPHKHFIPWVLGDRDEFKCILDQLDYSEVLYIVVIRNVFDWLRSFYGIPHCVHTCLLENFNNFISKPWKSIDSQCVLEEQYVINNLFSLFSDKNLDFIQILFKWINVIDDKDPLTEKPFENIFRLRERKYQNFIAFKKYAKNIIYVCYEDIKERPEEFLDFLAKISKQERTEYIPWTRWKDMNEPYKPKKYFDFTEDQLDYIEKNVNWKLEEKYGYDNISFSQ